jgi:exonuclease VII large subunit
VADRFSFLNIEGLGDKELHEAACKECKLSPEFKPDKDIKAAIDKFIEIQDRLLPTLKTIHSVLKGIKMSDTIAQTILKNMENQIELYHKRIETATERGETLNEADQILLVDKLLAQLSNLQKIAIKMPEIIDNLETLEERLTKENSGDTVARGGRQIGNRAEPNRTN